MTVRGFVTADGRTVEHGQFGGFPPAGDLETERQLADVLVDAAAERLLDGAQDGSYGGLAQALVEGALRYGTGARVALPFNLGVLYTAIGTTGGDTLHVGDLFDLRLDELRAVHESTLPVALER
jgi:phosphoribosylformylglycinamidine synthase subunit PurL